MIYSGNVFTAAQFKKLNAFDKGFVVYMCGAREDQPHVPETYAPSEREKIHYEAGQARAGEEVQDCP